MNDITDSAHDCDSAVPGNAESMSVSSQVCSLQLLSYPAVCPCVNVALHGGVPAGAQRRAQQETPARQTRKGAVTGAVAGGL